MRKSILLWTLALGAAQAFGGSITSYFGSPNFVWSHPGGDATPNHIWVTGDFWEQDFTGTGLGSANALTLNLFYNDNGLATGNPLDMAVSLNGTLVGTFIINPGDAGFNSYAFNFAPITGPAYDIKMLATNTIGSELGSVSMDDSGTESNAVLSGAPEPGTLCLLAGGLGIMLTFRNKKARVTIRDPLPDASSRLGFPTSPVNEECPSHSPHKRSRADLYPA
jgi:hypothetical protein